ncbi:MAG TPA: hypothetical protein EYQ21_00030 [Flavobacteriales bacterium]|nr:hypothetical protein [Flavobacteriales bacterium]
MIKAMLIVASLGINTEMPDMDSCLKARLAIMDQDATIKSLCIPKASETEKMREMFDVFLTVIDRIKELEVDESNNENRFCSDCTD